MCWTLRTIHFLFVQGQRAQHAEAVKESSRAESSCKHGAIIGTDEARTPRPAGSTSTAARRVEPRQQIQITNATTKTETTKMKQTDMTWIVTQFAAKTDEGRHHRQQSTPSSIQAHLARKIATLQIESSWEREILDAMSWPKGRRKPIVKDDVFGKGRHVARDDVFGENADEIDRCPDVNRNLRHFNAYLTSFTNGDANRVVRNSGESQGLEAWRRRHI